MAGITLRNSVRDILDHALWDRANVSCVRHYGISGLFELIDQEPDTLTGRDLLLRTVDAFAQMGAAPARQSR